MNISKSDIEHSARELQKLIWEQRYEFGWFPSQSPAKLFTPENGAQVLGIDLEIYERIPSFGKGPSYEIAGLIDRQSNKIALSSRFSLQEMHFTGGHELGHWRLHPGRAHLRERPIRRTIRSYTEHRDPIEAEADYFSACFCMPKKLVIETFQRTFGTKVPLVLNDNVAFALCPARPDDLLRETQGLDNFAFAVANARSLSGIPINSLSEQFNVSPSAMAYRLKELKLVEI